MKVVDGIVNITQNKKSWDKYFLFACEISKVQEFERKRYKENIEGKKKITKTLRKDVRTSKKKAVKWSVIFIAGFVKRRKGEITDPGYQSLPLL